LRLWLCRSFRAERRLLREARRLKAISHAPPTCAADMRRRRGNSHTNFHTKGKL
jgi:hypothetical protein